MHKQCCRCWSVGNMRTPDPCPPSRAWYPSPTCWCVPNPTCSSQRMKQLLWIQSHRQCTPPTELFQADPRENILHQKINGALNDAAVAFSWSVQAPNYSICNVFAHNKMQPQACVVSNYSICMLLWHEHIGFALTAIITYFSSTHFIYSHFSSQISHNFYNRVI